MNKVGFLRICLLSLVWMGGAAADEPTEKQVRLIRSWLAATSETRLHQMRGATENKLYLHQDGHREAVYDAEGELVQDGVNDGSYNYAHPEKEPLKHFNYDIFPWIIWGTSRTDSTSVEERMEAYSLALREGLTAAQGKPAKGVKLEEIEKPVIQFFVRVIAEGKVEEVYLMLGDKDYQPKDPDEIGKKLMKGLKAAVKSKEFEPVPPE